MNKALAVLVVLLFGHTSAFADVDLYAGEVPVASQSAADREQALPGALAQVLQKLTGLRDLPATETLDASLLHAANLLVSYRYQNIEKLDPEGVVSRQLQLIARFLPDEVDRLVQSNGLPRWPQQRPAVQIWVIIDDGLSRTLQPMQYEFAWQAAEQTAAERGLPIIWPQLDDEEEQLIDTGLVWGGFTDYLIEKGAPPDGVAIAAAMREGPLWNVRWTLTNGKQNWNWLSTGTQLSAAMVSGIQQMADNVSAANAIEASAQGQWSHDISVANLRGAADYARCLSYLQDNGLVTAVDVLGAEPGVVTFRLQLNASPEYLTQAFSRGAVLVPANSGERDRFEYLR